MNPTTRESFGFFYNIWRPVTIIIIYLKEKEMSRAEMYRFFNKLPLGTIVKTEKLRDFEVVNELFFHLQAINIEVKLYAKNVIRISKVKTNRLG